MCHDEKYSDEDSMELGAMFLIFSQKAEVSESDTNKRNHSDEIESDSNHITDTSPCSTGSDWHHSSEKEIEKYSYKVDASCDSCESTERSDLSITLTSEEDI